MAGKKQTSRALLLLFFVSGPAEGGGGGKLVLEALKPGGGRSEFGDKWPPRRRRDCGAFPAPPAPWVAPFREALNAAPMMEAVEG